MTRAAVHASRAGQRHRIDVHHHVVPPAYLAEIASRRIGAPALWTPELSIEDMDKSGIAKSVLSLIQPGVWFGDVAEARRLAGRVPLQAEAAARHRARQRDEADADAESLIGEESGSIGGARSDLSRRID